MSNPHRDVELHAPTLHQSDYFFENKPRFMISAKVSIRRLRFVALFVFSSILFTLLYGFYLYEPHIEFAFYAQGTGCTRKSCLPNRCLGVSTHRESAQCTTWSEAVYGPKKTEVQAGLQLRMGLDCYDLAGTIRSDGNTRILDVHVPGDERTQYHTYWRVDLAAFGPRQEYMLQSFFATQNIYTSRLILWSNGDLSDNEILVGYLDRYRPTPSPSKFVDIPALAIGTALEGSELLRRKDEKAWVDGDLIRLLLLWNYGGVWVDMDSLLTRDLDPLLEHGLSLSGTAMVRNTFVSILFSLMTLTDKVYQPFNGALMRFRQTLSLRLRSFPRHGYRNRASC